MRPSRIIPLTLSVLLISACGKQDVGQAQNGAATSPPESSTPAASSPTQAVAGTLWFDPAALSSCETTALVKVHWNAGSKQGKKSVDVLTVRADGKEAMFARHVRPSGMKRTGRWIRSGREFVLRDTASNAELARATLGTLPCGAAQNAGSN